MNLQKTGETKPRSEDFLEGWREGLVYAGNERSQRTSEELLRVESETTLRMRKQAFSYILIGYALVLIPTLVIIFLQGWKYKGFELPISFLQWLGGAIISEIAGFFYLVLKFLFPQTQKKE